MKRKGQAALEYLITYGWGFLVIIVVLGALAAGLIVVYHAQVNSLIHLYVVGVFCAFTLSQTGMVRHWLTHREAGWRHALAINATGATATGIVALVVVWTKFAEGAWMVVVAVPILVLTFRGIKRHYRRLRRRLDTAAEGVMAAAPFENSSLVVVEQLNGATRHAVALSERMAHTRPVQAVYVEGSALADPHDGWHALVGNQLPLENVSSPEGMVDAVRECVWATPHGGNEFVTVVIPEQFERPSLRRALRRRTFRLKLRLLQESGVAICDVSTLDRLSDEPLPERIAVRVLVSDARAASLRAAAYAASLGFDDTHALFFASTPEKEHDARAAWDRRGCSLPLEIVAAPYRDIADPVRAYAHQLVDADPTQALLYVVPEIVVTGWRRVLHNFRELHIKRSVLFDSPRIMLVAVPYHLR